MQITDAQITKFQTLYKKHFDEGISRERAHEELIPLVRMMQLIYKPMTKADYERLQERRRRTERHKSDGL